MKILRKIDIHVHTAQWRGLPRPDGDTYPTPEELIDIYDKIGVEMGNLLPEINVECSFDTQTNREIQQIVGQYPDRFTWFCNVDARQGSNSDKTDFSYFLNYYKSLGARGVGEISTNLYFDDPYMMNLFSHCEKCDMPVIFHIGQKGNDYGIVDDFGLPHLENVLKTFPKLRILGHSQKFWAHMSGDLSEAEWNGYPKGPVTPDGRLPMLMRKYNNLNCDLSAGSGYNALARDPENAYRFLEEFQDRIFYGTDICSPKNITNPMLKTASFLDEAMLNGKISYAAYEKISRTNALRLLGKI